MNDCNKLLIVLFLIVLFLVGNLIQVLSTLEKETITGTVTSVDKVTDDYITLTFSNNKTYNIEIPINSKRTYDFTVDSFLVIKIQKCSSWLLPNVNNVWNINSFTKLPGEPPC